ncbi:MAG: hypothetical protein GY710_15730 [Desulfobacteraceae bacterium]|nr:hypothetical protein [Desulfobacteraceae bacterium]
MEFDRNQITQKLNQKGATKPCHRCGNVNFSIIDGFSNIQLNMQLTGAMVLGGPSVPVVKVVCTQCGAISSHAVGVLGLLSQDKGGQ